MALVNCVECGNGLSDQAITCPKCGAPTKRSRKTHPFTWVILAVLIVAGVGYQVQADREAKLPPLPVNVKFRPSLLGQRAGYVLVIENTSGSPLPLMANLTHASVNDSRRYDLYIPARSQTDISKLINGWTTEHGDRVTLENANYKSWSGSVP
jgi:hypothetical protein